jgi:hypothetical protein
MLLFKHLTTGVMKTRRNVTAVLNILKGASMIVHLISKSAAAGTGNSKFDIQRQPRRSSYLSIASYLARLYPWPL